MTYKTFEDDIHVSHLFLGRKYMFFPHKVTIMHKDHAAVIRN